MAVAKICDFGKQIKARLVEINQTQDWLIEKVHSDTGLHFDSGYMHRTLTGKYLNPKIVCSICKILDLDKPIKKTDEAG